MTDDVVRATRADLTELMRQAAEAPLRRARLCAHRDSSDRVHEMLIALMHDSYVRPHRHCDKSESFHVIEGVGDVVVFDDQGAIAEVVTLGEHGSGRSFFYRLNVPAFHTLLVRSEVMIIHEATNGPFDPADTIIAPWAPDAEDEEAVGSYLGALDRRIAEFGAELD